MNGNGMETMNEHPGDHASDQDQRQPGAIGEGGSTDLRDVDSVTGGTGPGGMVAGDAAGAAAGSEYQELPGYGSSGGAAGADADLADDEPENLGDGAGAAAAGGGF